MGEAAEVHYSYLLYILPSAAFPSRYTPWGSLDPYLPQSNQASLHLEAFQELEGNKQQPDCLPWVTLNFRWN